MTVLGPIRSSFHFNSLCDIVRHIGVVVNPIAGMGGRVGLKGTDGKIEEARSRGAEPRAPDRACETLDVLSAHASDIRITTAAGVMGEDEARDADIDPTVIRETPSDTSAQDTRAAVEEFLSCDVDLVLFVGGDGTAVDVAETISESEHDTPMLGVPAGVKIYSSVFAVTPRAAGRIAATYDRVEQREVNDIDEDAYRAGEVRTELEAVVQVPDAESEEIQSNKQLGGGSVESLASGIAADVEPGTTYVLGPGSTVGAIKRELGFDGSPLGVDVWRAGSDESTHPESEGSVLVYDGSESEILDALEEHSVIVVSPIGGQGFVFGRGNQQLSPNVIRQSEVRVVASHAKLDDIGELRVDTGDPALDEALRGWQKVRVGRFEHRLLRIV
jgi:predicted polyphosphate/ATP-dependent NAD kinase